MKKNIKIITFVLSALLLIGMAIGISVSANESTPTVSVAYKNVAYEGAVKILYAVDAQGLTEGQTVQMYFYDALPTDESEPAYVKDEFTGESLEIGGVAYKAFFSDGIAPKNMRKTVYAVPVILNGEAVVAKGEAVAYSIYTYATNMMAKAPTEEHLALYSALLDYGASVQRVLLDSGDYTEGELESAGGYADEYYSARIDVRVDGKVVENGEVYKFGTPYTTYDATVANMHGNAVFEKVVNAEGVEYSANHYNKLTVESTRVPGVTVYYADYVTTGFTFNDFDDLCIDGTADDGNVNLIASNHKVKDKINTAGVYMSGSTTFGLEKTAARYSRIDYENGTSGNKVFASGATTTASGNTNFWRLTNAVSGADKYVYQTDVKWIGRTDTVTDKNAILIRAQTSTAADVTVLFNIELNDKGADDTTYTLGNKTCNKGEWYTLRIEIEPNGTKSFDYAYYIDGVKIGGATGASGTGDTAKTERDTFLGVRFFARRSTAYAYELDNVYVGFEGNDNGFYNDETTAGTRYSFDGLESINSGNVLTASSTSPYFVSPVDNTFNVYSPAGNSTSFGFKRADDDTSSGTTYVYETDMKFGGGTATATADQLVWFGMSGNASTHGKTTHFLSLGINYRTTNGVITSYYIKNDPTGTVIFDNILPDRWYNFRAEYTPNNTIDETTGAVAENGYGGTVKIYIDNVLVKSYTTNGYKSSSVASGSAANDSFENVGFEFRGNTHSHCTEYGVQLDNTYIGEYTPAE